MHAVQRGRTGLGASSSNTRKQRDANAELGQLAEAMVAEWLKQQGCQVLYQRWHCRWGEIDVVAVQPAIAPQQDETLVFVEVKARGDRNWDGTGLLSITPQKQAKLLRAASVFLAEHPQFANCACRFDVALVRGQKIASGSVASLADQALDLNQPVSMAPYRLTLQRYLVAAFE